MSGAGIHVQLPVCSHGRQRAFGCALLPAGGGGGEGGRGGARAGGPRAAAAARAPPPAAPPLAAPSGLLKLSLCSRTRAHVWVPASPSIYVPGRSGGGEPGVGPRGEWADPSQPSPARGPATDGPYCAERGGGSMCILLCARTDGIARFGAGQPGAAPTCSPARRRRWRASLPPRPS